MRSFLPRLILVGALSGGIVGGGCYGTVNATVNINANVMITSTIDAEHVMMNQPIPLDINVSGAFLVEPNVTPPPEHINDAVHLQIYLDTLDSAPILVTAQAHVSVMVAQGTPPGRHKLHCRLHKHDGTPTTTVFEFSFNLEVSGTINTDAGMGAESGTGG